MMTVRDVYNTPWYDHSKEPTQGALYYGSDGIVPRTRLRLVKSYEAAGATRWQTDIFQFFRPVGWNNLWSNTW